LSDLSEFFHKTDAVTISAAIAVSGVILSALVSALISRRTNYLNVVTAERSKWIEKLRGNLAKYPAVARAVFYKAKKEDWEKGEGLSIEYYILLRELQEMRSLLKLQLNPKGKIDQNIIKLVDRIYTLAQSWTLGPQLAEAELLLVLHAQYLLKAEWEKVKSEARGPIRQAVSKYFECKSTRDYKEFALKDGAIPPFNLTGS
jgi:hypothetical protein